MQGFTLFFPALASFLLHVDAGPLTIRGNNTNNVRTLTQPFSSTNLLVATHLFRHQIPSGQKCLHADILCRHDRGRVLYGRCLPKQYDEWEPGQLWQRMFLHQVGTWLWERNLTSDVSRLPSSLHPLGEEALTYEKQCPAVFPHCQDASCMGDPDQGCSQQPGVQFGGCNCTGDASEGLEQLEEQLEDEPTFQNGFDTPQKPPCPSSILCSDPKCDGINLGGGTGTCNAVALSLCRCFVDKTACPSSVLCSDPKCDGANGEFTCTHGALNTCPCS